MRTKTEWTEKRIAAILATQFMGRSTLIVPNCGWTGHECDLLVIERGLRIVDIEIKISRADLKADIRKDKWWKHRLWSRSEINRGQWHGEFPKAFREWPPKVWKHYFAMPRAIWTPDLVQFIPDNSGVLLVSGARTMGIWRHAKPNRDAKPIEAKDAINLGRLASLRMWAVLKT